MSKKIDAVRTRIAERKTERESLSTLPPNPSEVQATLRAWLRVAAEPTERVTRARLLSGEFESLLTVRPKPDGTVDLAPALLRLFGADAVTDALARHIASMPPTPTVSERAARLAELDRELFALECEEEALIEASKAAGTPIARRGDADVRAVLGMHD